MNPKQRKNIAVMSALFAAALLPAYALSSEEYPEGARESSSPYQHYYAHNGQLKNYVQEIQDIHYPNPYYPEQPSPPAPSKEQYNNGEELPIDTVMDREQEMQYFYLTY